MTANAKTEVKFSTANQVRSTQLSTPHETVAPLPNSARESGAVLEVETDSAAQTSTLSQGRRYKIGVVGAGARGETFATQLYNRHPRAELFGICDLDSDRLEKFCNHCRIRDTRKYTDLAALLDEKELDAVIITTPEWTHADVAIAAIEAGKHIYLEKAMAQNSRECRRIIDAYEHSNATAYLGFNLRAVDAFAKLKEIVASGVLGQVVHISGLEQLQFAHGAAFMRRYHRHSARSGGMLNTKCSHDLDILQWLIGHEHKVVRVSSFGGTNVFTPDKQPAKHCRYCPVQSKCQYRDRAGYVFPISGKEPLHHKQQDVYGADLCVFDPDKDLVDNQTVILEWDNGVRGSFNMQMFQHIGRRQVTIWGELGYAELNTWPEATIRVIESLSGNTIEHKFGHEESGHGGSDIKMIDRFLNAIEQNEDGASGLSAGLAATLLAEKADLSRVSGGTVDISPEEYL